MDAGMQIFHLALFMSSSQRRNIPLPAKQKPRPPIQLNLESIREKKETDDIPSKILKLKNESPEKPLWEGISSYGIDIKFWTARWGSVSLPPPF
jgi:hypothetical protein